MTLSLLTNTGSFAAQTNLRAATLQLNKSYERLSSGLRITSASDDAAGLALSSKLDADSKVASQAIRNASDGVSLVSIADGALAEIGNILTRMAELAEQSANGTLSNTQRSSLDSEFFALGSEVDRIARSTDFNDTSLLNNSSDVTLQVGLDGTSNSQIVLSGVEGTIQSIGLGSTDSEALDYSLNGSTSVVAQTNATTALTAIQSAIGVVSSRRGVLGAAESRLGYAINNLQNQRENFETASSQIKDVDVADETAKLIRNQIVQQAATSVLAQANQQGALALALLQ